MQERFREFVGKFVDIRSPQERIAAIERAEDESRLLTAQYLSGQISLQEYNEKLEIHYKNPDTRFDPRQLAMEINASRARVAREELVDKIKTGIKGLFHRGSQAS